MTAPLPPEMIDMLGRFAVYGVANDYDSLIEFVRVRVHELQTTHESIDAVSGLHSGYTSKIVAPTPIKSMGKVSLGPMLQTLGLALIIVRDDEQFKSISARLAKRKLPRMLGQIRPKWLFTPKKASRLRKAWWASLTPAQQKKHQRKAQKGQAASRRAKARKSAQQVTG